MTKEEQNTQSSTGSQLTDFSKNEEKVTVLELSKPFHLVSLDGENYSIAFGRYLITDAIFKSAKEGEKYLKTNQWEITVKLCGIIIENVKTWEKE